MYHRNLMTSYWFFFCFLLERNDFMIFKCFCCLLWDFISDASHLAFIKLKSFFFSFSLKDTYSSREKNHGGKKGSSVEGSF